MDDGSIGEQQLGDEARLRERAHAHVEALQVHERAHDDLRARRGLEHACRRARLVADVLPEQLLAIVVIDSSAPPWNGSTIRNASPASPSRRGSSARAAGSARGS